ncbi:MAG: glycosyltransferase family 39 protein [Solirubrobacteraceae bacterium]|jgi:4-amino-4-deoxy-L-arabinose transferase-like glycosyltransferase
MQFVAARRDRLVTVAVAAVTLLALALRVTRLGRVPEDEFYDAAVRSMTLSLHNFLYGALDPGASLAIDKPPLDLWLQVISVKLLGFGPTALKLPEALGGTAAVPLLYDTVRRVAGRLAGLGSALVLAILPLSVVSSRSDTMDSLMGAMLVATAWLLVIAVTRRRLGWLLGAGVMLGLAFNVKLFEALVPLPAFALFYWLATRERRLRRLALAAVVFAAVACVWLVFVSLTPSHDRPWPVGSTNGSIWNAVFVYNGIDRVTGLATSPLLVHAAGSLLVSAVLSPAGPLRLFAHNEIDYGGLIGTALFAAIVLGLAALAPRRWPARRVERGALAGLAVWLGLGYVLFSFSSRTHPRYLEAFTPAVAATLGVAFVVLARRAARSRAWALALPGLMLVCVIESAAGSGRIARAGIYVVVLACVALAVGAVALAQRRAQHLPRWCTAPTVATALLVAVLALVLLDDDLRVIRDDSTVQAAEVTVAPGLVNALSVFLESHQDGARYEAAVSAPTLAAPLIAKDARPVLMLTSLDARPLVTLAQLRRDAAQGAVRYVFTEGICPGRSYATLPACSAADEWVRAHATDVTAKLGLPTKDGLLYQLPDS